MQPGPKPTMSVDEVERFSLTQVNNMLLLADRFMDPRVRLLHKVGCKEPTFHYFLQKMKLYLKFDSSLFDSISARAEGVLGKIAKSENFRCEIDHVWARLIKHVFMNGNVLKVNDMRVIVARTIFTQGLRNRLLACLEESIDPATKKVVVSFDNLDRPAIQMLMSEFLGQLLKMGFSPSVKAIHNFLYLAKKVAKTPENGMSTENIAVTIAPCMLNALHLNNVLCPLHPKADETLEMKKENQFLTLVIHILLNSNRFDAVFDPNVYLDYHQTPYDGLYGSLMPTLSDPNRLTELVAVEAKLRKARKDAPEYTSASLEAALGAKEEEPLRSLALAMGKIAIDAGRSRNLRGEHLSPPTVPPLLLSQPLSSLAANVETPPTTTSIATTQTATDPKTDLVKNEKPTSSRKFT